MVRTIILPLRQLCFGFIPHHVNLELCFGMHWKFAHLEGVCVDSFTLGGIRNIPIGACTPLLLTPARSGPILGAMEETGDTLISSRRRAVAVRKMRVIKGLSGSELRTTSLECA